MGFFFVTKGNIDANPNLFFQQPHSFNTSFEDLHLGSQKAMDMGAFGFFLW
jgi:hypothetical protein